MGLETYLLNVAFHDSVPMADFRSLLKDCGATSATTANENFEIRDSRGLTEIQVDNGGADGVRSLFLRFSILSPNTVIDQAFEFLTKLSMVKAIKLMDTQLKMKELPIDVDEFKRNPDGVKRRQIIINNQTGLVIESGKATTDYIRQHHLAEKLYKID